MKLILFTLSALFISLSLSARQPHLSLDTLDKQKELIILRDQHQTAKQDTLIIKPDQKEHLDKGDHSVTELFIIGKNAYRKEHQKYNGHYAPFKGHWSGFQYGFINFTHVPTAWKELELDWSHSFAMQFNLFKYSINLSKKNNFGLVTGLGLEYQRFRFNKDNISLAKTDGDLVIYHPTERYSNIASIKRSTFKAFYLTIPLLMEIQFPAQNRKRLYVSAGIMGGLRMHSKTKIVYKDEDGDKYKKKDKGNFNMVPFKADVVARVGYRKLNVWGSYTLTNMFKTSDAPELHVYTVGIGYSF